MSNDVVPYDQLPGASAVNNEAGIRAMKEVEAQVVLAKRFPRDEEAARNKILKACERVGLAENSAYSFPRGGTTVMGPSIRMAEVLANRWGNLTYGIRELVRTQGTQGTPGQSEMQAYCWDMETNVFHERRFTVRHLRDKRGGSEALTSERDIYELTANMGARRVRACILETIPGDIVDEAMEMCRETLVKAAGNVPLKDRIHKMLELFAEMNVDQAMIEARLGHKVSVTSEEELVKLRQIYKTITDGQARPSDYFEKEAPPPKRTEEKPKDVEIRKPEKPEPVVENKSPEKNPTTEAPESDSDSPITLSELTNMLADATTAEAILEVLDLARSLDKAGEQKMIEAMAGAKKKELEEPDDDLPVDDKAPALNLE